MPPYQGGGGMINEVKKENITFAESPTKFEAGTMQTAEVVAFSESIKFIKKIGLDKISEIENNNEDGNGDEDDKTSYMRFLIAPQIDND